ncbi:Uncharacterized protein BM_BM1598 [Brugia malayi]|uniref:Uncharacterized protein n=2 Tax=Brugia malayi TaxID=6279 RepID=A0A4E9FSU4_BRUMA|nr:Uncharacterized protein BM_BM1598 [Brugia malayi]VIO97600.1 Uncharacterized protein BM_BM1598 [Brugia malayi]
MDEASAESSVEFLEEEVPMKSENKQTHKKRTKNNLKLKSHRGKQIRKSNSTEIDKRMISARNGSDSRSTMRSSSDTSVHYAKMNAKKKLKRKTKKKKTKASSTLEHELPSQQPPSLKENEMSDERWNETYQIFGKPKNGRKNKKQLSMEQFGTDQPVSKQYRGVRSMVEPIGCQKIVMKGWKPHYKVKKIWLQDLSKE